MWIDGFLKVPDIAGSSTRAGHEGEIEVHGLVYAMEAPRDATGVARVGRTRFDPVVVTKHYDMSSPYLAKALEDNRRFDEVVITVRQGADNDDDDHLVVTLTDAALTRYALQPSAADSGRLEEQLAFTYASIGFTYEGEHAVTLTVTTRR